MKPETLTLVLDEIERGRERGAKILEVHLKSGRTLKGSDLRIDTEMALSHDICEVEDSGTHWSYCDISDIEALITYNPPSDQ